MSPVADYVKTMNGVRRYPDMGKKGASPKALDLFCGLGGWSDGLALEGFEVLGVEINQEIADLYKHPVIVADVCSLDPLDFTGYDLIVGSPPCRDFSTIGRLFGHRWKKPPDPDGKGLELIKSFLTIVENAKPKYWLMENVPQLEEYLETKPRVTAHIGESMKRSFWGNYPAFIVPRDYGKKSFYKPGLFMQPRWDIYPRKHVQWDRSKIPLPVACALGRAVVNELEDVT